MGFVVTFADLSADVSLFLCLAVSIRIWYKSYANTSLTDFTLGEAIGMLYNRHTFVFGSLRELKGFLDFTPKER